MSPKKSKMNLSFSSLAPHLCLSNHNKLWEGGGGGGYRSPWSTLIKTSHYTKYPSRIPTVTCKGVSMPVFYDSRHPAYPGSVTFHEWMPQRLRPQFSSRNCSFFMSAPVRPAKRSVLGGCWVHECSRSPQVSGKEVRPWAF